jgi:putative mRNA 3-end processing factor
MRPSDLLIETPGGLYCPPGDFYVDPPRPAPRALITHAHSDHARGGHRAVLATRETLAIMALRLGDAFCETRQIAELRAPLHIGAVTVTFHPAGHVLGSAQIAVEAGGLRIVASGDYKRAADPTCAGFEPVRCDVFITEATFGLPVFRHPPALAEIQRLTASRALFPERAHLVGAYSLGKAQRLMALLRQAGCERPIFMHGAIAKISELYREEGAPLGDIREIAGAERGKLGGEIVICPPSALHDLWARKFPDPLHCAASGWLRVRARARQGGVELPLVISDHADWDELTQTIRDTGCGEVWVTHGQEDALVHWAKGQGFAARPLRLAYAGDDAGEAA